VYPRYFMYWYVYIHICILQYTNIIQWNIQVCFSFLFLSRIHIGKEIVMDRPTPFWQESKASFVKCFAHICQQLTQKVYKFCKKIMTFMQELVSYMGSVNWSNIQNSFVLRGTYLLHCFPCGTCTPVTVYLSFTTTFTWTISDCCILPNKLSSIVTNNWWGECMLLVSTNKQWTVLIPQYFILADY